MTRAPNMPSKSDSPASGTVRVLESVIVARVFLEHALGRGARDPIEFLATVELASGLKIGPLRLVLAEPTRVAIDWPNPLYGFDGAGGDRELHLSPGVRQQVADALVRHLLGADFGSGRP